MSKKIHIYLRNMVKAKFQTEGIETDSTPLMDFYYPVTKLYHRTIPFDWDKKQIGLVTEYIYHHSSLTFKK